MLDLGAAPVTAEAPAPSGALLQLVDAACVRTGGEFAKVSATASRRNWVREKQAEAAALASDLRPASRRLAFRAGRSRILLAELPGGVQRAVSPVQERGKPTGFWNYDFPMIRVCRVVGSAEGPDWWRAVGGLRVDGRALGNPVVTRETHGGVERTWAAPGFTHVRAVSKPDGSRVEFSISRQPESEAERRRTVPEVGRR